MPRAEPPSTSAMAHVDVDPLALSTSWRGHPVRVQAQLIPRHLFTTADITVEVDGRVVLHTGGQQKATGAVTSAFTLTGGDSALEHVASLSWGIGGSGRGFPVTVKIDDDVLFRDELVKLKNGFMFPLMFLALVAVVALVGFFMVAIKQ